MSNFYAKAFKKLVKTAVKTGKLFIDPTTNKKYNEHRDPKGGSNYFHEAISGGKRLNDPAIIARLQPYTGPPPPPPPTPKEEFTLGTETWGKFDDGKGAGTFIFVPKDPATGNYDLKSAKATPTDPRSAATNNLTDTQGPIAQKLQEIVTRYRQEAFKQLAAIDNWLGQYKGVDEKGKEAYREIYNYMANVKRGIPQILSTLPSLIVVKQQQTASSKNMQKTAAGWWDRIRGNAPTSPHSSNKNTSGFFTGNRKFQSYTTQILNPLKQWVSDFREEIYEVLGDPNNAQLLDHNKSTQIINALNQMQGQQGLSMNIQDYNPLQQGVQMNKDGTVTINGQRYKLVPASLSKESFYKKAFNNSMDKIAAPRPPKPPPPVSPMDPTVRLNNVRCVGSHGQQLVNGATLQIQFDTPYAFKIVTDEWDITNWYNVKSETGRTDTSNKGLWIPAGMAGMALSNDRIICKPKKALADKGAPTFVFDIEFVHSASNVGPEFQGFEQVLDKVKSYNKTINEGYDLLAEFVRNYEVANQGEKSGLGTWEFKTNYEASARQAEALLPNLKKIQEQLTRLVEHGKKASNNKQVKTAAHMFDWMNPFKSVPQMWKNFKGQNADPLVRKAKNWLSWNGDKCTKVLQSLRSTTLKNMANDMNNFIKTYRSDPNYRNYLGMFQEIMNELNQINIGTGSGMDFTIEGDRNRFEGASGGGGKGGSGAGTAGGGGGGGGSSMPSGYTPPEGMAGRGYAGGMPSGTGAGGLVTGTVPLSSALPKNQYQGLKQAGILTTGTDGKNAIDCDALRRACPECFTDTKSATKKKSLNKKANKVRKSWDFSFLNK